MLTMVSESDSQEWQTAIIHFQLANGLRASTAGS